MMDTVLALRGLLLLGPVLLLCSALAHAQMQGITPAPDTLVAADGAAFDLNVRYDVSDASSDLAGIGLRLHWDSSRLAFDGLSQVLSLQLAGQDTECQNDGLDYDRDPATDCYVLVAWARLDGQWPRRLPASLFTAAFTSRLNEGESTRVNFSASSTAPGYELDALSATVCAESPCGSWTQTAYSELLTEPMDLDMLRAYRDEVLRSDRRGALYTQMLYESAEASFAVLAEHPALMAEARQLLTTHRDAVAAVLAGEIGLVGGSERIGGFLRRYAQEAPLPLKLLALQVANEVDAHKASGEPLFGFALR